MEPADRGFIGSRARPGLPSVVERIALQLSQDPFLCLCTARPLRRHAPPGAHGPRRTALSIHTRRERPGAALRHRCGRSMAPPPGQTNRDTSAADHTTCFYCHQQLILVSHKVIVSRDAHGCSIRICEPCEKEARRRRPVRPFAWLPWRSRRRRAGRRARHRAESRRRRLASFAVRRAIRLSDAGQGREER